MACCRHSDDELINIEIGNLRFLILKRLSLPAWRLFIFIGHPPNGRQKSRVDSGEKILTFCAAFQIAAALQHPFISMEKGSDSPDDSNGKCGMEKREERQPERISD